MIVESYLSVIKRESALCPGVVYRVERMSFGRRIELMKAIREVAVKIDFLDATNDADRMADSVLSAEVDRLYLQWGLKEVDGLLIDGVPATPESLVLAGPEELSREALAFVISECGLNEAEKKT